MSGASRAEVRGTRFLQVRRTLIPDPVHEAVPGDHPDHPHVLLHEPDYFPHGPTSALGNMAETSATQGLQLDDVLESGRVRVHEHEPFGSSLNTHFHFHGAGSAGACGRIAEAEVAVGTYLEKCGLGTADIEQMLQEIERGYLGERP